MTRNVNPGPVLTLRAIGGLHVVTLAWDFAVGQEHKRDGLLGFAVERAELDASGQVVERYWLRGIKRFKHKDEGTLPGSPVPTSEHPIQSFQWGDYTAKPATTYRFRVVPVYGKPKLIDLDEASGTTVQITTEAEVEPATDGQVRHDIYFNRGAAGSQAYARKFGKLKPDQTKPESEQMKWLSRGLFEALVGFIGRAAGPDAGDYKLRAMLYEFRYPPVGEAFKAAADAGADVAIRYEAQSYKDDNEKMIADTGIGGLCAPQKVRDGIRHNKFIVLIHKDVPVGVWTGSTNISAGGIFGHSNVGHAIWDRGIAERYLAFWEALASADVTAGALKKRNLKVEPTPAAGALPPAERILTLFSPRDAEKAVPTLHWYAGLLASARRIACMTFAFNFDAVFSDAVNGDTDSLNYLVFDKAPDAAQATEVQRNRNTVIAVGAKLEKGDLETFREEYLTGFNKNRYIHDKFLLVDPLGTDPIVVTGTANFSKPSQVGNDENMVVIRGDTRVSDIYFGEFMRIFDHLYARYIVAKLKAEGHLDPEAGYLKEATEDWLPAHFKPGPKEMRRRFFMG